MGRTSPAKCYERYLGAVIRRYGAGPTYSTDSTHS